MASKKQQEKWYYCIVMTGTGPVFVTGTGEGRTAHWDREKPPMEMTLSYAEQMALGLTWNGHLAFAVASMYEVERQPYRYSDGCFEWKFNDSSENNEKEEVNDNDD